MMIKTSLLAFSLSLGLFSVAMVQAEPSAPAQNSSQSVTLDMQNMTCPMCKFTIKKAIQGVDGVQDVNIDYDNKSTAVTFDAQKTNIETIIEATTNAGYPATVHQAK